ncbi:MAG TPA: tetratricopeptide repeat protein [Candidatus Dormibacteraeota bacterium]|nr:tetratricopeptide repeat protein [Candidatus Dormibacteraeota bacterium]
MRPPVDVLPTSSAAAAWLSRALAVGFVVILVSAIVWAQNTLTTEIRAHILRAEQALQSKDIESAAQEFRAVLALDSRNVEAHVNLGVIAMMHGDCQVASRDFRAALAVQPSQPKANALLAICSRRLGDPSAKVLLQGSFSKLTDASLRTQVGMELVALYDREGDAEHAVAVLQKLVGLNPDSVDILYAAQRLYRELADETLNKLAIVAPASARMQQVIAQHLINAGEVRGAINHYKRALEIDSRIPGVHYELAQAILESDSSSPAIQAAAQKEFETAIAVDGDSGSIQCKLGRIALLLADTDGAHTHYARAFAIDPQDAESQLGLGTVLMMSDKLEDARKYLEMAVRSDPLNDAGHYRLAQVYRRLQMADKAKKEVELSIEIKKTKEQVAALYRQMNERPRFKGDDGPQTGPSDTNQ